MFSVLTRLAARIAVFAVATIAPAVAVAGGGPEGVLLVVNSASDASKEIANHYVRLRGLPPSNVLYLDYRGGLEITDGKVFREQILGPILTAINVRDLERQIDTVAYSCDFPWQIRLGNEFPEGMKFSRSNLPIASLTGATYLWQTVLLKSPTTVSLGANWYAGTLGPANRHNCSALNLRGSRAFRGRYSWRGNGQRAAAEQGGRRFLMATMLGVTTGRGNTVDEVIESLRRASYADTSPPRGTFFFVRNRDVRSKTRHNCYEQAAAALNAMGAKAVVETGVLPKRSSRVAGMMLGHAKLPLGDARLKIEPGAICEHLTSSGGDLRSEAFQTPLSALIRAGAAGASGTVFEPLALQAKFPAPSIQVHYRRGGSLAEAFYQSVAGPYQLLIVGDPLCQPWAVRPAIEVDGWPPLGAAVPEEGLRITPRVSAADSKTDAAPIWELFVDGRLKARARSGSEYEVRRESLGPGWHSLRTVGIAPGPLETQQRVVTGVVVAGEELAIGVGSGRVEIASDSLSGEMGKRVRVTVKAPGAERVAVRQNFRTVGEVRGAAGSVAIETAVLGRGPIRLQAVAQPSGAASAPLWIAVD